MNELQNLNWRAIMVASIIGLIVSAIMGVALGYTAVLIAMSDETTISAIDSPAGDVIGFIVSLIPTVIGVLSLLRAIDRDEKMHCLVFGAVNVAILLLFAVVVDETSFAWDDILFYVSIIPTAMITQWIATH